MFTVHLRINDRSTNRPVPVRLRLTDATGACYPPLGRLADFRTGPGEDVGGQVRLDGRAFAYIDGTCEVRLPPGAIRIEVSRGPEYAPLSQEVPLAAGQISLRLAIERWADWRPEGWYSGDTRAHHLSPQAALLEGAAEGLAIVQVLAQERPASPAMPAALVGLLDFSGNQPAVASEHAVVQVNTLNVHPVLGSVALLHSHRPVYPLRFGAPAADDWSVADWCDQCHRKTGLVVWPDLPRLDEASPQGEALAALVLGKVDAFEVATVEESEPAGLMAYYALLDAGLRPTLVGGSGKQSNATALGSVRTYAQLGAGEAFSADAWIAAVRAGRTFLTTAPLVSFTVDGQPPGSVRTVAPGGRLRLRVEAQSAVPFDQLELLVGGNVLASKSASGNRQAALIETDFCAEESTWIAARCHGADHLPGGPIVFAHTTPVWVEVPERPVWASANTLAPLLDVLDRTLAWVEQAARCETDRQRAHLRAVLSEARQALTARQR